MSNEDLERERLELERQRIEVEKLKLQQKMNYHNQSGNYVSNAIYKVNSIKKLSIASLIFTLIGLVGFIVGMVLLVSSFSYDYYENYETSSSGLIGTICISIFALVLVVGGIIELGAAIKILSNDFGYHEINDSKILWGLLSIFLLGWIASLIFAVKSKRIIERN